MVMVREIGRGMLGVVWEGYGVLVRGGGGWRGLEMVLVFAQVGVVSKVSVKAMLSRS